MQADLENLILEFGAKESSRYTSGKKVPTTSGFKE